MACTCHSSALAVAILTFFTFLTIISTVNSLTFSDPDNAYAQYLPDWLPAGRQAASFRFKSVRRGALILLHHLSNRTSGEPAYNFWIELKAGKLQATHVFETFVETVTIGQGLDNDQWHDVDYSKDSAGLLRINLNGKVKEIKLNSHRYGSARDRLAALTHNSVVTIGGVAAKTQDLAPREFSRLLGCIDRVKFLTLNGVLQEIPLDSTDGTQEGCNNKCFQANKCQQGQCINQYYRTICDCFGTGYSGEFCQTAGNVELTLQGHNYIQYQFNMKGETVSKDKMRITLGFKVGREHQSGVLFYAAGSSPVETYLAVYMQEGKIVIKASLGGGEMFEAMSTPALNDDKWHKIFIRHDSRFLLALIDDVSNSYQVTGDNTYFHLDPDVYVGGGPDLKGIAGLEVSSNLVGCVKEVYVDYENLVGAVKTNASMSMVKFHGGEPIFECLDIGHTPLTFPTKRSQLILDDWTTGAFNLQFAFRTSFSDGVMIHTLISIDNTPDGYLTVRLVNGTMELKIDLGTTGGSNRIKAVSVGTSLHNTAWHDVSLALRTGNILLTVDGRMVGIPHKHRLSSRSSQYLGSDVSGDESGFEGCMRQIRVQGTELLPTEIVGSIMDNGVVIDGCMIALNPCATGEFVCENGGACTHESNGTRCICNGEGYTGSRCQFPIYKKSCEDYFRSGDRESGPKMIDIDGVGPFQAAHVMCDFSMGRPKTTIAHNFAPKTLVRSASGTSLDFELQYREMTPEMLAILVKSSSQCRQLFSYWCYKAPLRLGGTSKLFSPTNKTIDELPTKFQRECGANKDQWQQDIGYLDDKTRLPITKMRFLKKRMSEVTRATLTLGPLECFTSVAASKPNTATLLTPETFISVPAWKSGTLSFIFRTSTVGTVLFHQTRGLLIPNSMIGTIAEEKLFVFEVFMNGETRNITVETTRPMLNGEWHTISMVLGTSDILFSVDSETALLSLPVGEKMGQFRGPFKLGGSDELANERTGFSGCVSALNKNGKDIYLYDLYNEYTNKNIKPGCVSACASRPCQNGGHCLDKWTTYVCECAHAAHQGENCEIDNTKDVVSFSDPGVHLSYTPSTADILTSDIHLSFRTYQSDALLFYANDHFHNFIQLELMDSSMLIFKYNSGRQIIEVMVDSRDVDYDMEASNSTESAAPSGKPLNDGLWVDVSIKRSPDKTVLMTNEDLMQESTTPIELLTEYHNDPFNGAEESVMPPRLFANSDMVDNYTLAMIGGAPDKMTSIPGLQGCVRGVMIGDMPVSVQKLAATVIKGVSTNCDGKCSDNVCQNGGTCTEMWSSFRCNCTTSSYSGRMCSKDIGATFQSSSLMMYPFSVDDMEPAESTEMDSLTFGFSTETSSGVLVYIRGDDEEPTDNYIVVKLVEGNVEASVDFGNGPTTITIEGMFNDGYRHVVELRRYGNRILFDVDHLDGNYTTLSDSEPVQFNKRAAFVVGGVEYNMSRFSLEGSSGYEGCIAGLNYNGIRPLELLFGASAPSDKGGVEKSQCAAFKESATGMPGNEVGGGPDLPDPSLGSSKSTRSGIFTPWNVAPAVGQVYVEPKPDRFKLDPDIIKYIIIAICAVAIIILLLCILCMACKLAKKNEKEKKAQQAKNYEDFDAAPSRYTPTPHKARPLSYQPVPQTEDRPKPARPLSQPPPVQNEPEVVAMGQFTVEATPELKDEPPIPMIDEEVEDEVITTKTPLMANEDVPPPVPTSSPPPLTPPQSQKSVTQAEPDAAEEIPEKKPLVKTDSVLSDAETAV